MAEGPQPLRLPRLSAHHGSSDLSRRSRRRLFQQGLGLVALGGGVCIYNSLRYLVAAEPVPVPSEQLPASLWMHDDRPPCRGLQADDLPWDPDSDCKVCKSTNQVRDEDKLKSKFKMVDHENLKDPNSPKLRFTGAELVFQLVKYLFGILYMMTALAVVCDEFFVPALECFVDEFQISMDVAGATFMAAGGSMPELFTSFIATFDKTEVGFATIVGSAVFNVLFVVAVCAIASKETLVLTWWPLARDCTCYLIALCTVAFVFKVSTPGRIDWWEAVILLAEYAGYCTFMAFNQQIHSKVEALMEPKMRVTPEDPVDTLDGDGRRPSSKDRSSIEVTFHHPSRFRKGIVHLLTQNAYLYETAGIAAVTQVEGDLEETFRKLDVNKDNVLSIDEIGMLLTQMGCKPDSTAIRTAMKRINRSGEEEVSYENFKRWYIASEARIEVEIQRVFTQLDTSKTGRIERDQIATLLRSLGHDVKEEDIEISMREIHEANVAHEVERAKEKLQMNRTNSMKSRNSNDRGSKGPIQPDDKAELGPDDPPEELPLPPGFNIDEFEVWYKGTLFFKSKQHVHELQEDAEEHACLNIDIPEGASRSALFWFVFTYPLTAAMYCTLPDCRNPKYRRDWKIAVLEFTGSLVWIGIFSNVLYECIVVCSNTVGLPPSVAAVTVLAAGTSVPDLLSSYIVAKNGEGDMAVSSSIGSNIFDVTVGLPLPWLCFCIVESLNSGEYRNVEVKSNSLFFSLLVLIAMLVAVIGTIMACGWRLTKPLGWIMMLFYVIFVCQDLMNQLPKRDPPEKSGVFRGAFDF